MFIVPKIQASMLQKSQARLEFSLILNANNLDKETANLSVKESEINRNNSGLKSSDAGYIDKNKDQEYVNIQAKQQYLDSERESLESELKVVQSQKESMDKLVQNNIEQDTALWCVGGK